MTFQAGTASVGGHGYPILSGDLDNFYDILCAIYANYEGMR